MNRHARKTTKSSLFPISASPLMFWCGVFVFGSLTILSSAAFSRENRDPNSGTGNQAIVSNLVSDDFNNYGIDPLVWTFDHPGDATVSVNGTQAELYVPAGQYHDLWGPPFFNTTARLVQSCNDANFTVQVKFESVLTSNYQGQGIQIYQDADDLLWFNFHRDVTNATEISVFRSINGVCSNIGGWGTVIAPVGTWPLYMRVTRIGNKWVVDWSLDETNWTMYQMFTHIMTVSSVGVYAGNSETVSHTAVVDYFFNMASPIDPEDPDSYSPPRLDPISDISVMPADCVEVLVSATDPDSDPITLSVSPLPDPDFVWFIDYGNGTGLLKICPGPDDIGVYELGISATDECGLYDWQTFDISVVDESVGDIVLDDLHTASIPQVTALLPNFPNPFNPMTTISFDLSESRIVRLVIYNLDGRQIATLINEQMVAGHHEITWTGKDDYGHDVASGSYIYRIEAGEYSATRRMVLIR